MRLFVLLSALSLYSQTALCALTMPAPAVVESVDIVKWLGGLIFVLAVFFLCVWLMRKTNLFNMHSNNQMQIIGGLSLGAKERLVLVQLGSKQLVLGVCPGRVETLHVLEGDDCLAAKQTNPLEESYATKFSAAMTGQVRD